MNIQRMKQWIKALRSQSGAPTVGWLNLNHQRSSLGILCDLYIESLNRDKNEKFFWRANTASYYGFLFLGETVTLPEKVQAWVGLNSSLLDEVIQLNDTYASFQTVADFLEMIVSHEELHLAHLD